MGLRDVGWVFIELGQLSKGVSWFLYKTTDNQTFGVLFYPTIFELDPTFGIPFDTKLMCE